MNDQKIERSNEHCSGQQPVLLNSIEFPFPIKQKYVVTQAPQNHQSNNISSIQHISVVMTREINISLVMT